MKKSARACASAAQGRAPVSLGRSEAARSVDVFGGEEAARLRAGKERRAGAEVGG